MLSVLSITPSGDFDLRASLRFSEGWEPAAIVPSAGGAPVLRLAFAVDGWDGHAAVALTQDADGVVHGELAGTGDPAVAWRQALRSSRWTRTGAATRRSGSATPWWAGCRRASRGCGR